MQKNKNLSLISFNTDYDDAFDKNNYDDNEKLRGNGNLHSSSEEFSFFDSEKTFLTLRVFQEFIDSLNGENEILPCDFKTDVKLNIVLKRKRYYRLYGCAVSKENVFYKDVLVRLFKYKIDGSRVEREEIDKSFTSSHGEFNFIVEADSPIDDYRVEIDDAYREF